MDSLRQDFRFALRMLTRNYGFAFVAIATLALGIGGITSVFSVVNGVMLRPLPYGEPDRLVTISTGIRFSGGATPSRRRARMPPS